MSKLYSPNGPAAYQNTLMVAAHLSMRGTDTAKRHTVWMIPANGTGRGLAESDPKHKAAVKKALEGGALGGASERWTEESGDSYTVREA